MIVKENESLAKYTTFRMGGVCRKMFIPQTQQELIELYETNKAAFKYCIGGGSNLLIDDQSSFDEVVNLREFNTNFEEIEPSVFIVGASLRLQELINEINKRGYGGIEYLFSVPGLVGGAIFMNAGRGAIYSQCISDYILEVTVLEEGNISTYLKKDCDFSYRSSIFQNKKDCIILNAKFQFPIVEKKVSDTLKKERIELCKKVQDNSGKNFGTVFCVSNKMVMEFFRITASTKSKVHFSKKTRNWIINNDGTFEDTIKLINKVKSVHSLLKKNCRLEVKIWEI